MIKESIFLLVFSMSLFSISCQNNNTDKEKIIFVDTEKEMNCEFFIFKNKDTVKFARELLIVENKLRDTIILGNSVLAPNQTGKFAYTKFKNRNDVNLDLNYKNPLADRICVSRYKDKIVLGSIKVKLKLKGD